MPTPIVILDSSYLRLITCPGAGDKGERCNDWLETLLVSGYRVAVPEICDYETRRDLIRRAPQRRENQIHLDNFIKLVNSLEYIPLNTFIMCKAAELWAYVRQKGKPTAPDYALDGDVILAAQALHASEDGSEVTVATENTKHLCLFVKARPWEQIS